MAKSVSASLVLGFLYAGVVAAVAGPLAVHVIDEVALLAQRWLCLRSAGAYTRLP